MKRILLALLIVAFVFAYAMGTAVKRFESSTGTVVDTFVTNVKDTSSSTAIQNADESADKIWDMFVVGVDLDTFVAVSVADTTHLNDSVGALVKLYACKNQYVLLLDSQTTTSLPDSITLTYGGGTSKLYEGLTWDSLRIDVIGTDSILTTNDSASLTWRYLIKKIELKNIMGDENR